MIKPTKGLVTEVYKRLIEKQENIISIKTYMDILEITYFYKKEKKITINKNIFEFAFKVKEWTEAQGFNLVSSTSFMGDGQPTCMPVYKNGCEHPWIDADTEVEAIIKAGEWVLEQLKDKQ